MCKMKSKKCGFERNGKCIINDCQKKEIESHFNTSVCVVGGEFNNEEEMYYHYDNLLYTYIEDIVEKYS